MGTGAEPMKLFALLFLTIFFNFSMICMTVGPLTSESVPAALTSTATGLFTLSGRPPLATETRAATKVHDGRHSWAMRINHWRYRAWLMRCANAPSTSNPNMEVHQKPVSAMLESVRVPHSRSLAHETRWGYILEYILIFFALKQSI